MHDAVSCLTNRGCTVDSALNFDSNAALDCSPSSCCVFTRVGCTDSLASNFQSSATIESGECLFPGCTDVAAPNYNPSASYDDGSCVTLTRGCTDSMAVNFVSAAAADDGSCIYAGTIVLGCTDSFAVNYDPLATNDPPSRDAPNACRIAGCTDSLGLNFNPRATFDDGGCAARLAGCMNPAASNYRSVYNSPCTSDDKAAGCVACALPGCTQTTSALFDPQATYDDGSCFPGAPVVRGCADSRAANFLAGAADDGSCRFPGCTNSLSRTYNPSATFDDGVSCGVVRGGCTDSRADNLDPAASYDDGSCVRIGCTNPVASNYDRRANLDSGRCVLPLPLPPLPPEPPARPPALPPLAPGSTRRSLVTAVFTLAGSVESFDRAAFTSRLLVAFPSAESVSLTVSAASVAVTARLILPTATDANAAASTLSSTSREALSDLLGVTVEAIAPPTIEHDAEVHGLLRDAPSPPPPRPPAAPAPSPPLLPSASPTREREELGGTPSDITGEQGSSAFSGWLVAVLAVVALALVGLLAYNKLLPRRGDRKPSSEASGIANTSSPSAAAAQSCGQPLEEVSRSGDGDGEAEKMYATNYA